ncbi:MAG: hypothetical protein HY951_19160 [Bacteroidia bacterium]|nr:hypothetical protein [Bacteroidia bacterium]
MRLSLVLIFSLFAFVTFTASKCNKEDPPKAIITVVDEAGKVVPGATVKVYSDPTYYNNGAGYPSVGYYNPDEKTLYDIQTSDGSGQTSHSFKYESIYSVKVTILKKFGSHTYDTMRYNGAGALILKNDKTYSESITIFPVQ